MTAMPDTPVPSIDGAPAAGGIPDAVARYLARRPVASPRVVALAGDASTRRYFRITPGEAESFVLAVYPEPFDAARLPFLNVAQLFAAMPVPIPRVRDVAADLGIVALDDLGDVTLQAAITGVPPGPEGPGLHPEAPAQTTAWYRDAVEIIATIQQRGTALEDARFLPYGLAFDVEKLTFEMEFFIAHFLEGHRGVRLAPEDAKTLRRELAIVMSELAAEPRVVCHRDYHSRNLMVRDGRLVVIDFQDARMGPDTYDLASLLRDSYVELSASDVDTLVAVFLERTGQSRDAEAFGRRFDLMALQRNLKALGTFGYQASVRGNDAYLPYVSRTLGYVRDNLRRHPRFDPMAAVLGRLVPELG
jgi:aminoglycoside/choline kinase family phosphotransferase